MNGCVILQDNKEIGSKYLFPPNTFSAIFFTIRRKITLGWNHPLNIMEMEVCYFL